MASLEKSIKAAIRGNVGIAAVVGTRVRPLRQGLTDVRPYLTYEITSRELEQTLGDGPADHRRAEFEVGIFSDTYDDVIELSDLLRELLADYGATVEGIELDTQWGGETDVEEAYPEGQEKPIYLRVLTFTALYRVVG